MCKLLILNLLKNEYALKRILTTSISQVTQLHHSLPFSSLQALLEALKLIFRGWG